jgi:hypothetical protein
MATPELYNELRDSNRYFLMVNTDSDISDGWKLSIQGKTVQDAMFLYDALKGFLYHTKAPFKMGTKKLIDKKDPEQSTKLMTIYVPNGIDVKCYAELVYRLILDYKGWYDIKPKRSYEHYAGGIFFRNDREDSGAYIPA